ncbi:uncharacterized protein LOC124887802 [Capsicum annuum]|uniref:uncharacterized protein LOC124887802 n=1 Tax=Capsicum annuum TaxID=4072 RepID=UPI001FB0E0F9|nr:uncharacterized protein LOC124887802 [Capsicum annuum]
MHHISVGLLKWRLNSRVLYDKKVPPNLKGKFYRVTGAKYWPVKNSHIQKLKAAKMRKLQWMCVLTRRDKAINDTIQEKVKVALVEDKIRNIKLRRFAHMMRRITDASVQRCESLALDGFRWGRRRTKKYYMEVIRHDIEQLQLTENMTLDRKVWRMQIRVES